VILRFLALEPDWIALEVTPEAKQTAGSDRPGRDGFNRRSVSGQRPNLLPALWARGTGLGLASLQRLLLRCMSLDQLLCLLLVLLFHLR
jgi:hypothetical protein